MQKAKVLGGVAAMLGATILATLVVRAQQSEERAARFPIKQHPHDIESTFIRMPLPAGYEQYAGLQGKRLKQFVHEVAAISRQSRDAGDLLWGRVAGTKYHEMAESLVETKFKEFGLEGVRRQFFDLAPQWFPVSADVRVSGSGETLTFTSIVPGRGSDSTPAAGLDLDVVWVGLGSEGDFAGRDVRGKLVVIESFPMPSVVGHSAEYNGGLERAAARGAAAVLVNIAIPGNLKTAMSAARDANRRVPTFSIGSEDLAAFLELKRKGAVKAHVQLTAEMRPGLRDANVWGTLPGTSDEDIIVLAHHDAFFEGALDNGSGMGVLLGLAEYYSKIPKEKRRRTLRFVSTSGHHGDGITPGSLGTRWLHDNRATALAANRAGDQRRACLGRPGPLGSPRSRLPLVEQHLCATLVGERQRQAGVARAQRLSVVRRDDLRRHGSDNDRRHESHRPRRAIGSTDRVRALLSHRSRPPGLCASSRARSGRTRLRQDHRRREPCRSVGVASGGGTDDVPAGGMVTEHEWHGGSYAETSSPSRRSRSSSGWACSLRSALEHRRPRGRALNVPLASP